MKNCVDPASNLGIAELVITLSEPLTGLVGWSVSAMFLHIIIIIIIMNTWKQCHGFNWKKFKF